MASPVTSEPKKPNPIVGVISLFVVGGLAWFFFGGGLENRAAVETTRIEAQVADDQVKQYEIAKRQGDRMQICVQAGLVSAAFLQAKNETEYQRWKAVEAADCRAAGVPR